MAELTHFNDEGRAKMVDVSAKSATPREAVATAKVLLNSETFALVVDGKMKKGDVLAVAQVAGIMAAKKCADIIPMCHPIALTGVDISFNLDSAESSIAIRAMAKCIGETGVEMEALTAASVAALTIYDMCKAAQRDIIITDTMLLVKSGGKSGCFNRKGENMAKVTAVCISEKKGVQKCAVPEISLKIKHGIVGDAHAGDWHRQVSLLGDESVEKLRHILPDLPAGAFAENILTEGIILYELPVGTKLRVGDALLEVTQIGKECHKGCAIREQTGDCVMPREGIFAIVLEEGVVKAGDSVKVVG